ncbi:MAG: transcriptional repressor LexA, partial [Candidatus Latescibacteria bacterium]|nr:transcriptional repressor LexA [Candidatus Latescibacterota bacterium]
MKEMTKKQQRILNFIQNYIEKNGYPPSYDEIAVFFKVRKPTIFDHLNALQKKGYLEKRTYRARTLVIKHDKLPSSSAEQIALGKQGFISIPILGKIAAGTPLLAVENLEGNLKIDRSIFKNTNSFALRVKGDSMINAGINDGDLVIINMQPVVEQNEIAAVLLDDEVTLKYYRDNANAVTLTPANKKY